MTKKEINPNQEYSLADVVRYEFMGKGKSYFTCRSIITEELWIPKKERILKATKKGKGVKSYYFIKGENLIKYLKS